jgi:endonuclease G
MAKRKRGGKKRLKNSRLKYAFIFTAIVIAWSFASLWYVHHPRKWLQSKSKSLPKIFTAPLCWLGNPLADITDALGITGHDAIYEYDQEAPSGNIFFAGAPVRIGPPATSDVRIINRGDFIIGWSDSLKHPLWCAYHITPEVKYDIGKRPGFTADRSVPAAPKPSDYTKSGYDRGHMVPNYAIITRYGEEARRKTFMMSNITPQTPALNRGVWREFEHRIADLWTARYGELWVIVGCIPDSSRETISGTGIDVPSAYYQLVIAQEGMDVRALAVLFDRDVPWREWAARNIISIDELECLTGLDFNPDLPAFIQDPLEAETPSRLWPIRKRDIITQISLRFP